jgi:hypothetical protein
MTNVIDMTARRNKKPRTAKGIGEAAGAPAVRVDRDTYELWMLSQDVDALLLRAVAEKGLALEEVAAILAHRLGTLVGRAEHPERLLAFCQSLLERLQGPDQGPGPGQTPERVG